MPRASNTLRIIAGSLRRRHVRFAQQPGLRPTPDRVRETLFNWLGPQIVGAHCLDLFAGSGILGLEALSRGAASCTWVENDRASVACLKEHIALFGLAQNAQVHAGDARVWLKTLPQQAYNVVFLDPPYGQQWLPELLAALMKPGFLAEQAWLYVEHEVGLEVVWPDSCQVHRSCKAGQVAGLLLRYDASA